MASDTTQPAAADGPAGQGSAGAAGQPGGLLRNIRVLDLSRILSGPWAGQQLGDLGADVVKVERPGTGDDVRAQGAPLPDAAGQPTSERSTYLSVNRAKRSVCIDIACPEGQDLVRRLAAQSDVLLENFKTGDLARHGLDAATLCALNPRLVYCSITGFGQTGPYAPLPGYDLLFQAMGGVMSLTGVPEGEPGAGPQRAGYPVSDLTAGFCATIGVLAALHHRDTVSGRGQHIDLSLLDAQVAAVSPMAMGYLVSGQLPVRSGISSQLTAPYGNFSGADGQLLIAVASDKQFAALCQVVGQPGLPDDARFGSTSARANHRVALAALLNGVLRTRPVAHWMPLLRAAGVPAGPIHDMQQVFDDPQIRHRQLVKTMPHPLAGTLPVVGNPLNFSANPITYDRPPPLLGQHTREVLQQLLGLDDAAIDGLAQRGVVA